MTRRSNVSARWVGRACGLLFWGGMMGLLPAATGGEIIWTESVDIAFKESDQLGRPILALGVGAHCGPCQELKRRLRESPSLATYLERCVVLEMDCQTADFRSFVQAHPDGYAGTVPMVYLFGPDQKLQYAQPGLVSVERLAEVLSRALEWSGPPLDRQEWAEATELLHEVRDDARTGRFCSALMKVHGVASRDGAARVLQIARGYERQLLTECQRRADALDRSLGSQQQIHAAAYRLAHAFVQLRELPAAQEPYRELLEKYESLPETSSAILQAKHLVRARVAEQRAMHDAALNSYQAILKIDGASPIAKYASRRLPQLEEVRRSY